jgi:hypothetical protein
MEVRNGIMSMNEALQTSGQAVVSSSAKSKNLAEQRRGISHKCQVIRACRDIVALAQVTYIPIYTYTCLCECNCVLFMFMMFSFSLFFAPPPPFPLSSHPSIIIYKQRAKSQMASKRYVSAVHSLKTLDEALHASLVVDTPLAKVQKGVFFGGGRVGGGFWCCLIEQMTSILSLHYITP